MSKPKIMVIDDEPNNLRLIATDLHAKGFESVAMDSGQAALRVLDEQSNIELIILDRMMPKMNGIEFIAALKKQMLDEHPAIIMLTAAAQTHQIAEGIAAGVFYYITKPYDVELLYTVINAALADQQRLLSLRKEVEEYRSKIHVLEQASFSIQRLDQARFLATFLSNMYPDPKRLVVGIHELLINAIEHGNLGITYGQKTALLRSNQWLAEIEYRSNLPANINKRVAVSFWKFSDRIELQIQDQGAGFDWQDYLYIAPERATDPHGRGIAMSKLMSFDELTYCDGGRQVRGIVWLTQDAVSC